MPITAASTVSAALQHRAAYFGSDIAHCFVRDGATDQSLSFAEMEQAAGMLAAVLAARLRPQDRVVLVLQPGLEYSVALLACFRARMIAVPTFPPRARRLSGLLPVLCRDCGAALVLTDARSAAAVTELARQDSALAEIPVLAVDRMDAGYTTRPTIYGGAMPEADDLAVLQYTSGSTGAPKGVMVTHRNLVENLERQCLRFGVGAQSRLVSWLPPYHDMGLVAGILQAPYSGCRTLLLSPMHAMQRPVRWLQAISRMRATISGGPPFGYDLCVDTVTEEERAGLDLSSWECAFMGAEPIAQAVLDRFAAAFAPCGFRAGVFAPCYGMAEATLMVTGRAVGSGSVPGVGGVHGAALRASSGHAVDDDDVRVVDPAQRRPCADGVEGEIWVRGASVAAGYWGNPSLTQEVFHAALRDGSAPWLRTGDLGVLSGGELMVTGRIKDMIIFAGRKLHPEDIEATLRGIEDERVRAGAIAAFGAEVDGRERVVVALELKRRAASAGELAPLRAAIQAAVTRVHEVPLHDVQFLGLGELPRTSSGKIRRHMCAQNYLAGAARELEPVA